MSKFNKVAILFATFLSCMPQGLANSALRTSNHALPDAKRLLSKLHSSVQDGAENVRRNLQDDTINDGMDTCLLIEALFGEDFVDGPMNGSCDCEGMLTETFLLSCTYENICHDELESLCADLQVNITLEDVIDPAGGFGQDPTMDLDVCMDVNVEFLEIMCVHFDFEQPDFFEPDSCEFKYGGEQCLCTVEPCFAFDCDDVVPDALKGEIKSSECQYVNLEMQGTEDVQMFLPALATLPDEDPGVRANADESKAATLMTHQVVLGIVCFFTTSAMLVL
mmetsp:Transcript_2393/g.3400  ORF Transcript_2393/g.3400 Transcript_2393/m.3400 type:complete len:279 (+) Transcript_2393:17-853(+)